MRKAELIMAISQKAGVEKKEAESVLNAFLDVVSDELAKGGKVQIVGFGTFETTDRPARECRNPRTGETMEVEASRSPKFKPGKALKDAVNIL